MAKAKWENLGRVLAGITTVDTELSKSVRKAQRRMAEEILYKSQRLVPRITGNLANSKFIREEDVGDQRRLVIGYSANYALAVHEVPRPKSSNGVWKYLETPYLEIISSYKERVMRQVRADLRKAGK